jgi:hypothetical protein
MDDVTRPSGSPLWVQRGTFKDDATTSWQDTSGTSNWVVDHSSSVVGYDIRLDLTTSMETPSGADAYVYVDDVRVRIT